MAEKHRFADLPQAAQNEAIRIAERRYLMTVTEVQERYDAGTYDPFAQEDLTMQVPEEFRMHAVRFESGEIGVFWRDAAYANMQAQLSDEPGFSPYSLQDNIEYAPEHVQRIMAMMTADELKAVAAIESPDRVTDLPYGLTIEDIGYRRGKSRRAQWINAFWYHQRDVRGYAEVPERLSPLGDDERAVDSAKWINRGREFRWAQQDAEARRDTEAGRQLDDTATCETSETAAPRSGAADRNPEM